MIMIIFLLLLYYYYYFTIIFIIIIIISIIIIHILTILINNSQKYNFFITLLKRHYSLICQTNLDPSTSIPVPFSHLKESDRVAFAQTPCAHSFEFSQLPFKEASWLPSLELLKHSCVVDAFSLKYPSIIQRKPS
jgi:hypothetical protein